jgi:hypothetical protein
VILASLVVLPMLLLGGSPESAAPPPEMATPTEEPNGADGPPPDTVPGNDGDGVSPPASPLPAPVRPEQTTIPVLPVTLVSVALLAVGLLVPLAFGRIAFAIAVTAELIILGAAAFIAAVAVTTYAPNATFGRPSDYYTLVTAATSSGALGGVFGMLTYWKATGQGTR